MKTLNIKPPAVWCSYSEGMWLPASSISPSTLRLTGAWFGAPCYFICLFTVTWAYLYLFPPKEDVCNYFTLADTLTFGLSTGQRIWIHFLVTNRGDQCGAQVRSSPSTEQCQTTHNSEHSSFDHLKMNRGADKPGSPHYYDIQGRSDSLTWGFDSFSLWWEFRTQRQKRLCTQTWSDHQPFTYIMGTMTDRNEGRRQGEERKTASFGLNKEGTNRMLQDVPDQIIPSSAITAGEKSLADAGEIMSK